MLPASAGMIPLFDPAAVTVMCAPRIRGDDPPKTDYAAAEWGCSPHPRG